MAEHVLAVLVDFENMARPGAKSRGDFDIDLVLSRLAEKGRVVVKRAYADWSRYREAKIDLQNAGLELIEMPSAREGAKNRADIKLAVDAMELAYSREHVDNFVIVSGDSDFTPLVGKLRELNKRVIGMGNRESSSELLIANCDEFIFYDSIASSSASSSRRGGGRGAPRKDPVALLAESMLALQRESVELPLASVVKDAMRRKDPAFDESAIGFSTFSKFLESSQDKAGISLQTDPRSGTYRVSFADAPAAAAAAAVENDGDSDSGNGDPRRRRRRGRRGEGGGSGGGRADASASAGDTETDADVFEVFVTPTPDPDLGQMPSLDQPITYEDMVLLTPEVDAEVAAAGVTEDDPSAPPARSTRRRRRRASADDMVDGEPTPDDLETVADEDVAAEQAAEEGLAVVGETPSAEVQVEEAAAPTRRRVRRSSAAKVADEAPAAEAAADAEAPADEKPKRRRAPAKKKVADDAPAAEAAADAEAPADEKPKRRRAPAKKKVADEAPAAEAADGAEAPADEKPKRRRPPARKAADAEAPAAE